MGAVSQRGVFTIRKSIAAALKLSEYREKLNDLNAVAEPTDAQRTDERALLASMKTTETEYREALTDEANEHATVTGDPAEVEYRAILGRGNVGRVLSAVMEHRSVDGAESEIQQARGLASNQIPIDLLRLPQLETRAVTSGPTNVGVSEQPPILPIFAAGVGAFLMATRPIVPMGDLAYPILDQRPDVHGPHTDSTAHDETSGSFSSSLLQPARLSASYSYKRVDAARFPAIDMALRQALNSGLEERLDHQLIAGADGLLRGTNLPNHAAAAVTGFADYVSEFGHARVDGRYAAALADVRTVVGSATYSHMGNQYRSTTADYSALDALEKRTGGVRVSAHVPDVASSKQNAVIRMGSADRAVVQPVWEGVTILVSEAETALAKKGEIAITALLLCAIKILRPDSFFKQEVKHS